MPEQLVLCGDSDRADPATVALRLDLAGRKPNVVLRIGDLDRRLLSEVPDRMADLLEIAAYVYAADRATTRGGAVLSGVGTDWRRSFRFVVPVRRPDVWRRPEIMSALTETLGFLSDDSYAFEFRKRGGNAEIQRYFDLGSAGGASSFEPDAVALFSGGVDSLAGAAELSRSQGKRLALVSHRSASKIASHQARLVTGLRDGAGAPILHIPVRATRVGADDAERTQRTRSFLYAALAAVVAQMFGRDHILFFENGVVSLNLPMTGDVLSTRATRTTHPRSLSNLSRLLSLVVERPFEVRNPYFNLTKAEVFERVVAAGCADLIAHTVSCTRVRAMEREQTHCGICSQCIDRRFGALAAGLATIDPPRLYKVDLFTAARPEGEARTMAEGYVRRANEIDRMDSRAFFTRYPEVLAALPALGGGIAAGNAVLDLMKRHARSVCEVVETAIRQHAVEIRQGSLEADSLLAMVVRNGGPDIAPAPAPQPPPVWVETEIIFEPNRKTVTVAGRVRLKGASFALLDQLRIPFEEDLRALKERAKYRFTTAKKLARALAIEEPTLRKRVLRIRKTVRAGLAREGLPASHDIVENQRWQGYRLDPSLLLVAPE